MNAVRIPLMSGTVTRSQLRLSSKISVQVQIVTKRCLSDPKTLLRLQPLSLCLQFSQENMAVEDDHADKGGVVLGISILMTILAIMAVALRFLSRKLSRAGFWWDDWVIVMALARFSILLYAIAN